MSDNKLGPAIAGGAAITLGTTGLAIGSGRSERKAYQVRIGSEPSITSLRASAEAAKANAATTLKRIETLHRETPTMFVSSDPFMTRAEAFDTVRARNTPGSAVITAFPETGISTDLSDVSIHLGDRSQRVSRAGDLMDGGLTFGTLDAATSYIRGKNPEHAIMIAEAGQHLVPVNLDTYLGPRTHNAFIAEKDGIAAVITSSGRQLRNYGWRPRLENAYTLTDATAHHQVAQSNALISASSLDSAIASRTRNRLLIGGGLALAVAGIATLGATGAFDTH